MTEGKQSSMRSKVVTPLLSMLIQFVVLLYFFVIFPLASAEAIPSHFDKSKMKKGCGECHKGHGKAGTPMLAVSRQEICFSCHGMSGNALDIYSELLKVSNHRILETAMYHKDDEELSGLNNTTPRHASCYDCHNMHKSEKDNKLKGVRGSDGKNSMLNLASREYEVCYKCHSDRGSGTIGVYDVSRDFASTNPSYHPVEKFGKNMYVPSLKKGYHSSSVIDCSDCHGNNDQSGPKGPHGSVYSPILKYYYSRTYGIESEYSYQLCYSCHDRNSIITDESFKAHKLHIVYNQVSCAICHDAHGSISNPSLVVFESTSVFPNTIGQIIFHPLTKGRPRCYLSCHINGRVYEHKIDSKLLYSINGRSIAQW